MPSDQSRDCADEKFRECPVNSWRSVHTERFKRSTSGRSFFTVRSIVAEFLSCNNFSNIWNPLQVGTIFSSGQSRLWYLFNHTIRFALPMSHKYRMLHHIQQCLILYLSYLIVYNIDVLSSLRQSKKILYLLLNIDTFDSLYLHYLNMFLFNYRQTEMCYNYNIWRLQIYFSLISVIIIIKYLCHKLT